MDGCAASTDGSKGPAKERVNGCLKTAEAWLSPLRRCWALLSQTALFQGSTFPTQKPRTLPRAPGPALGPVGAGLCEPGAQAPYLALGWLCPDLGDARRELPVFPSPYMERLLGEAGG